MSVQALYERGPRKVTHLTFRTTALMAELMKRKIEKKGLRGLSQYMRDLVLQDIQGSETDG